MREGDLAGSDPGAAAADEGDGGGAVVGCAERWAGGERGDRGGAGGGVDAGDLERGLEVERGQDRGEAAGEHRLADAGRADEEQVVCAGRGRGEREPGVGEAAHVDEVEGFVGVGVVRPGSGSGGSGQGSSPFRHSCSSPRLRATRTCTPGTRLASAAFAAGTITHVAPARARASTSASVPTTGRTEPSRPSSPSTPTPSSTPGGQAAVGARERERDRELEPRSGLAHRCGREVHRDAFHRVGQPGREQRGADPFARLASGGVGEADDRVAGKAARHVDFHGHDATDHSFEHCAVHRSEHATTSSSGRDRGLGPRSRSVVRRS